MILTWFDKGRQTKWWLDNIKGWTGRDFASSARAAEYMNRWKRIVVKASVVPQTTSQGYGID